MMREIYELFPGLAKKIIPFVMLDPMRETDAQAGELRKLGPICDLHKYDFFLNLRLPIVAP